MARVRPSEPTRAAVSALVDDQTKNALQVSPGARLRMAHATAATVSS